MSWEIERRGDAPRRHPNPPKRTIVLEDYRFDPLLVDRFEHEDGSVLLLLKMNGEVFLNADATEELAVALLRAVGRDR